MSLHRREEVWKDTQRIFQKGGDLEHVHLPLAIKFTSLPDPVDKPNRKAHVCFWPIDCVDACIEMIGRGYRPLLLNMAHAQQPGGPGRGRPTQEEALFLRSNYSQSLLPHFYPFQKKEIVFSPGVFFVKKSEAEDFRDCLSGTFIDCVACPVLQSPVIHINTHREYVFSDTQNRSLMKERLRMVCKLGIRMQHNCLILSALGCGSAGGPKHEMAHIFREVLLEFQGFFKVIVFAIFGEENRRIFTDILYR